MVAARLTVMGTFVRDRAGLGTSHPAITARSRPPASRSPLSQLVHRALQPGSRSSGSGRLRSSWDRSRPRTRRRCSPLTSHTPARCSRRTRHSRRQECPRRSPRRNSQVRSRARDSPLRGRTWQTGTRTYRDRAADRARRTRSARSAVRAAWGRSGRPAGTRTFPSRADRRTSSIRSPSDMERRSSCSAPAPRHCGLRRARARPPTP
jgi:hypothetical protein